MNMKAKKRILCTCEEIGFDQYNVLITVPKEHPFGKKGMLEMGVDVGMAILDNGKWKISFSRESFGDAIDDAGAVVKYLDDMLENSKVVDQHKLLGASVTRVDMTGDDYWKITFSTKDGGMAEMYGDYEDHFIVYEA